MMISDCRLRNWAAVLIAVLMVFAAAVRAEMPVSDSYRFERSVVPGGGGAIAAPGRRLQQVVWQSTPVGAGSSASYKHLGGFLAGGGNIPAPPLNILPGDRQSEFVMVSFTRWIPDNGCQAVFDIAYDPEFFRIGTYDAADGGYVECGRGLLIEPGRAYWVLALDGLLADYSGWPVLNSTGIDVELFFNPADGRFPGGNGWNMVAPPNSRHYEWADLQVVLKNDDGTVAPGYPLALSDPNPGVDAVIDRRFWTWTDGRYVSHHAIDSPALLQMNAGGWVRVKAPGVWLRFPAAAGSLSAAVTDASWQRTALATARRLTAVASAVADDGMSPPLPLGDFSDLPVTDRSGSGGGCFIDTVATPARSK